jgi:hypothetical protein
VRDAFKAMPVKTDRNDARGIACTAPGSLDNRLVYAARLKVSSCQAARMSAGLR